MGYRRAATTRWGVSILCAQCNVSNSGGERKVQLNQRASFYFRRTAREGAITDRGLLLRFIACARVAQFRRSHRCRKRERIVHRCLTWSCLDVYDHGYKGHAQCVRHLLAGHARHAADAADPDCARLAVVSRSFIPGRRALLHAGRCPIFRVSMILLFVSAYAG